MKTCKACALSDNIGSVRINEQGLCNYCVHTMMENDMFAEKQHAAEMQLTETFAKYGDKPYQVLLAYSGGKDSTFTLYQLRKKYNVSVLAVTFDNGFLTEQCRQNIHEATASLDVDSVVIKPSFFKLARIFQLVAEKDLVSGKALERASAICTACIGIVKATVYKEAIMRNIPVVCFGWTPGQVRVKSAVLRLDYRMIATAQKQIRDPILQHLGEEYGSLFLDPEWIELQKERVPYLAYPLVFSKYSEEEIIDAIGSIGWKKPSDTDTNSTNCLLNSYANFIHAEKFGYNPYAMEISGLIRAGYMSKEDGMKKISESGDQTVIAYVANELNRYKIR